MAKNLELKTTTVTEPRGELNFNFHSAKSQRMYSLIRLESNTSYVRPQTGSFGFDLIIPMDSLTVIPFSCSEKNIREFDNVDLHAK